MITFLGADCHTNGPHNSTHLDSCSVVGLVDEGNTVWAYSVTTFFWADCHTHGSHKSMYLDSYSAVRLVDEGNVLWAYSVTIFLWADYDTKIFSLALPTSSI